MSISGFFNSLGAPLANNRWSWGAQRPSDGAVFLRVWQDLKFVDDGQIFMLVASAGIEDSQRLGAQERARHVASIRRGAPCYLVMCVAKDVGASPRAILEFNDDELFVGAEIIDTPSDFELPLRTAKHVRNLTQNGATWIRLGPRAPMAIVAGR